MSSFYYGDMFSGSNDKPVIENNIYNISTTTSSTSSTTPKYISTETNDIKPYIYIGIGIIIIGGVIYTINKNK